MIIKINNQKVISTRLKSRGNRLKFDSTFAPDCSSVAPDILNNELISLNIKNKKIGKKAQEEMVGLAVIMVILAIIGLVGLSFFLRRGGGAEIEDIEITNFLEAAGMATSNCTIGSQDNYQDIDSLIKNCNGGNNCNDGRTACEMLNTTMLLVLESSWKIGEDRPVKYYKSEIFYSENITDSTKKEMINALEHGNCSGSKRYGRHAIPANLYHELTVCTQEA